MKYVKGTVTIIEMNEEDIIRTSGCTTAGYQMSDSCTSGNHVEKGHCETNGHIHAIGG